MEPEQDVVMEVFSAINDQLKRLKDKSNEEKVIKWIIEKFGLSIVTKHDSQNISPALPSINTHTALSQEQMNPKDFIAMKKPQSDSEKVVCLAYYLTKFRNQEEFRTEDISKLRGEAALGTFSNISQTVNNCARKNAQYFSSGSKGDKRIAIRGEALVEALPDRERVEAVFKEHPVTYRRKKIKRVLKSPS